MGRRRTRRQEGYAGGDGGVRTLAKGVPRRRLGRGGGDEGSVNSTH